MRPGFRIRAARREDVEQIVALERGIAEASHWAEPEYASMTTEDSGGRLRRCLFVAEEGAGEERRVIGFAAGRAVDAAGEVVGELENVAVAEEVRRGGTGKALCEAVIEWCKAAGAGGVELEVRSKNAVAIALYRRLGFVEEGRRRAYYREPVDDAVLMRLCVR